MAIKATLQKSVPLTPSKTLYTIFLNNPTYNKWASLWTTPNLIVSKKASPYNAKNKWFSISSLARHENAHWRRWLLLGHQTPRLSQAMLLKLFILPQVPLWQGYGETTKHHYGSNQVNFSQNSRVGHLKHTSIPHMFPSSSYIARIEFPQDSNPISITHIEILAFQIKVKGGRGYEFESTLCN